MKYLQKLQINRLVSFLLGGGAIALIGMALLYVQVHHLGIEEERAFAIQLIITLILNFLYNQSVTWRDVHGGSVLKRAGKFLAMRGASLLLSMALFVILTSDAIGMHYMAANIVCLIVSTAMNFTTSHLLVFTPAKMSAPAKRTNWLKALTRIPLLIAFSIYLGMIGISLLLFGVYDTIVVAILIAAVMFAISAALEARWRLYGWRNPEAIEQQKFPKPDPATVGSGGFSLIVPARNEAGVLRHTLEELALQTHPHVQIIATLIEGDDDTIADAEAARMAYPDRITVQVRQYPHQMKPHQLNAALELCTGEWVGVIDAEDTTTHDLLEHVEAAFLNTRADIVQGGVQLMNLGQKLREWFCVHNVLEYFFWFSSRMVFQARNGFVPLGGNTVFIRRDLLVKAGGWPISLTEDCALGVSLTTEHKAQVAAFYDPRLTTREETPDDIHGLLHQRIRWDTGFGVELLNRKWWQLPSIKRRALAWYILATPFLQAGAGLLLPLTILSTFLLDAPVPIVMIAFIPYIPILLSLVLQIIGLGEFGKQYEQKVRVRHYAFLILGAFPYQLVLAWAAVRAVKRIMTNNNEWYKTPHTNKHRAGLSGVLPSPAPVPVAIPATTEGTRVT